VPDHPELTPDRTAIPAQVVAEDLHLARRQRKEAGAHPQDAGLAGAVGPLKQYDLTRGDIEVDTSEGREAPEEGDGGVEADGGGQSPTCYEQVTAAFQAG
jgi:hypothetical protein